MLTTLSINNQEIRLVAFKGKKVKCWTSRPLESDVVRDGRVVDPGQLGETIADMFKTLSLPRNKVVVALGGLPYTYRIIDFPLLKESQVEEAITRAMPDEFTIPVEDLYISWARLITRPESADYFVLGADRELVDSFVDTMRFAGIKDWSIDLEPLALARAADTANAIVASLDLDHLDIVLVRGGHIKELHSAVLDREGDQAEFTGYREQFVNELVKILSYHHDDADAGEYAVPITDLPILVTGELITPPTVEHAAPDEEEVTAAMSKLTGHSVSLIKPTTAGPDSFNTSAYAANVGLFLKTQRRSKPDDQSPEHFHDVNIDILSGRYARKPVMVPMWYTVAPVVVFLVVFGAWSFNNAYSENNAQMEKLQVEMAQLTAAHTAKQQQIAQQTKLQNQVSAAEATLQKLQSQHRNLLAGKGMDTVYIADFRSDLPEGATLTDITISSQNIQLSGTVADPFDVITYIRSLEADGYTPNLQAIDKGKDGTFTFRIVLYIVPGGGGQ